MNLTEVKKSLDQQFAQPLKQGAVRNIIFWYDEEGVFADAIDSLSLENANIVKLYHNNMFAVKLHIERTDTENNLLIYSPMPHPDNRESWLTDIVKYSQTFSTDETSINLLNFKIDNSLRSVVDKYKKFFRAEERCKRLFNYGIAPDYTESKIDIGVLSALCKLSTPNIDYVIRTLLIEMVHDESTIYDNIAKFGNIDTLWLLIERNYGYKFPEQSLEKLAILLLCSHFSHNLKGNMPIEWKTYVSENPNCFVFVDNLMRNSQFWDSYNRLAVFVAEKMGLSNQSSTWTMEEVVDCDTFEDFDKLIIKRINENITLKAGEYGHYLETINSRKNRRYYPHFAKSYNVLLHACNYMQLSMKHKDLSGATLPELFNQYVSEYYKLDTSYRHFNATYDSLSDKDEFNSLLEMVENSYTNWFLNDLSMKWCALWDDETKWRILGVTSQQRFYERFVKGIVSDKRVIVIISDGLRYESAVELNTLLNHEQKGASSLDVMLGAIPSNTSLGMASLLPQKDLTITPQADYQIGGISTEGTANREKILRLERKDAIAIQYEDVDNISQQQLAEKFTNSKLIYIYHNVIDARGDNASTENEVFNATEKAFKELSGLVLRLLRSDISVTSIIITADHGYIYRRTPLEEHDKTPKQDLVGVKSSRRYILAKENTEKQGTQNFAMDYITKNSNGMYAIIPRITNCFKLQGSGSRYVHGGTTLQETVIPVIKFKSDKKHSKTASKVSVGLISLSRKVTSTITHLKFHQNEPVDDKHLPIRITAYFADESGNKVSNENIIIADSTDKLPERRVYKEKFTLKNMVYDKGAKYFLILKDEEETVNQELERIPFVIDLVFGGSIQF